MEDRTFYGGDAEGLASVMTGAILGLIVGLQEVLRGSYSPMELTVRVGWKVRPFDPMDLLHRTVWQAHEKIHQAVVELAANVSDLNPAVVVLVRDKDQNRVEGTPLFKGFPRAADVLDRAELNEGQLRRDDFFHNAGWFRKDGSQYGWGDLSRGDLKTIQRNLGENGEIFVVVEEEDIRGALATEDFREYFRRHAATVVTRDGVFDRNSWLGTPPEISDEAFLALLD